MMLWLLACSGGEPTATDDTGGGIIIPGTPVESVGSYVGIDADNGWIYTRADTARMTVDDGGGPSWLGDVAVSQLTYEAEDLESGLYFLHTITWAAGAAAGIQIQAYDGVEYSTPISIAAPDAHLGDTLSTPTDSATYTATLVDFQSCPNSWVGESWTCLYLTITGGSGELFVGEWWLAAGHGASRFQPAGEADPWVLFTANQ